ncbi:PIN domain nuclease [Pleurocapsa sp. CCALA 161]|uniref:type II toxin-antitoxin system VapC family toxin n=1 Tax=Pleurocapsa sp. CCALA 161 TaxID=2107688 RepID=UPI000D0800E4|nr:PIN domain-containing protein [Pleurocapsa sp. CCALA 161]PSB12792.1 PIN domain nuclease [Pleurocapsa sp. CCALA 161]
MKVLLDTNVILDFALERYPWFADSEQIIYFAEQKQILGYVSASTISDIYYIIRKSKSKELALEFLLNLSIFCQIAAVDSSVISMALNVNFKDFEDAIQYSTAMMNGLNIIVTRNPQDFPVSIPTILTPSQLIKEVELNLVD